MYLKSKTLIDVFYTFFDFVIIIVYLESYTNSLEMYIYFETFFSLNIIKQLYNHGFNY